MYTSLSLRVFGPFLPFFSAFLTHLLPFSARFFFNATLRDPKREQRRELARKLFLDAGAGSPCRFWETLTTSSL